MPHPSDAKDVVRVVTNWNAVNYSYSHSVDTKNAATKYTKFFVTFTHNLIR